MKSRAVASVSEKGQVKILRDRLGIRPGQLLEFEAEGGVLVGRKVFANDGIDEVYGTLDLGMTVDEYMEWLRGPREEEAT